MAEDAPPPVRLMNFVSQEELDIAKQHRGERVEDGTAQRDRPLFEILKENKDKRDAEFNERFKHRPPKALDEDETDFLDKLETSRKEYERHIADEEAEQLRSFQHYITDSELRENSIKGFEWQLSLSEINAFLQEGKPNACKAAVAAQSMAVHEVKERLPVSDVQEKRTTGKKNPPAQTFEMIIKVKPQKKAKVEQSPKPESGTTEKPSTEFQQRSNQQNGPSIDKERPPEALKNSESNNTSICLVSYSDESDDD